MQLVVVLQLERVALVALKRVVAQEGGEGAGVEVEPGQRCGLTWLRCCARSLQ